MYIKSSTINGIFNPLFVLPKEAEIDYIITQFVAETLKSFGIIDGFTYESSQINGINTVLFSDSKVKWEKSELYRINAVDYNYKYLT